MFTMLQPCANENADFKALKVGYQELFKEPRGFSPLKSHDHNIPLKKGSNPVNLRSYRHLSIQKDVVERMVKEMLDSGIIQHNYSLFASLVVLIKKKNGSWRLCINYRAVNKLTVKDKFLIPLIDDLLEELVDATIFF